MSGINENYRTALREIIAFAVEGGDSPARKMWLLEKFSKFAIPAWEKNLSILFRNYGLDKTHVRGEFLPGTLELVNSFWIKFQERVVDNPPDSLKRAYADGAEANYVFTMLKYHFLDQLDKINTVNEHASGTELEEIEKVIPNSGQDTETEVLEKLMLGEIETVLEKYKKENPEDWLILQMTFKKNLPPRDLEPLFEGNIYYRIRKAVADFQNFFKKTSGRPEGGSNEAR